MAVERIFKTYASHRLRGYVIQQPIIPSDAPANAREQLASLRTEPRLKGWWDARREIGTAFARTLRFPQRVAWDVYLVYPPGVQWTGSLPPVPLYWLSQHEVPDEAHFFEPKKLEMAVGDLLYQLNHQ